MDVVSPITKKANVTLICSIPCTTLIDTWQQWFGIDIASEVSGINVIDLYECDQTGLRFFSPPDVAGSGEFYSELQKFDWYYMPNKWEHQTALETIKKCDKVLEIGCGIGGFVNSCVENGIDVKGIELNQSAVREAQKNELPVYSSKLEDVSREESGMYDVVCSFQVLEHISTPYEFIQYSLECLKPGGTLILCVPNSESFIKHKFSPLDMPPHHMLRWSVDSFHALENIYPIKLTNSKKEPLQEYHLEQYMTAYGRRYLPKLYKVIINRYSARFWKTIISKPIREKLTGQSLYIEFSKITNK